VKSATIEDCQNGLKKKTKQIGFVKLVEIMLMVKITLFDNIQNNLENIQ